MKCFVFETSRALNASKILLDLMINDKMVPFVRLDNLSHIILPRVARLLPYFRDNIFGGVKPSRRVNLLFKDFNILDIVKVDKAHIDFHSKPNNNLIVELYIDQDNSSVLAGALGFYPMYMLLKDYNYLTEMLPYDLREGGGVTFNVVSSSQKIVANSIVTFTLFYTLFNFDRKITIDGDRYQKEAIDYINHLMGRFKEFGDNFYEAIENLKAFATIL